jgi:hypothetical protein
MNNTTRQLLIAVLLGGFIAGSVDIFAAALIYHANPVLILHAIASGLLGKAAFQGGASVAALGLVLQWVMSWLIAACYVVAAHRLHWMNRNWLYAGLCNGVVIYIVMNYVVRPLSAAWPPSNFHFDPVRFSENMLAMLLFGLIIAFTTRRVAHGSANAISAFASPDSQ